MTTSSGFYGTAESARSKRTSDDTIRASRPHIDLGALEMYVLKTISPAAEAELEEHLMFCHSCQNELDSTIKFVMDVKSALSLIGNRQVKASLGTSSLVF